MANKIINDLTSASALTGPEVIEVEQSGASKKTTPADLKTYMGVPPKIAWVNFNGTGTVAIRASSSNVSSITDNGVGDYTINFSPAFADANYAVTVSASANYGSALSPIIQIASQAGNAESAPTSSAVRIRITDTGASGVDLKYISVIVMGN